MSSYVIGIDLGRLHERAALSVIERIAGPGAQRKDQLRQRAVQRGTQWTMQEFGEWTRLPEEPPVYECRHLHRWQPGTPYTRILDDVARMVEQAPQLAQDGLAAIDITVTGTFIGDMFEQRLQAAGLGFLTFEITGGSTVTGSTHSHVRVPKRELASVMQLLLSEGRIKVAAKLPDSAMLLRELHDFKVEKLTNDDTLDWRERDTDDLVLATASACWVHEKRPSGLVVFPVSIYDG